MSILVMVLTEDVTTTDAHFLTKKLLLLMEDVPLRTRHEIFFQHDGAPPYFGQVMS
jgi:hypothetical protein